MTDALASSRAWPPALELQKHLRRTPLGERLFHAYGWVIGYVLAWYMLFDHAGAYVHVPGTPMYAGETTLALGVLAVLLATPYLRRTVARDPLLMLLACFMLWGLLRALPQVAKYHLYTVRDSALWYYGAFALLFVATTVVRPELPRRLLRQFCRFIPVLLLWLPVAEVVPRLHPVSLRVPFTSVTILEHRSDNIAMVATIALAGLWLLPYEPRSAKARNRWSLVALATIGLAGTQSRAGLGAAGITILVALVFRLVPHPGRLLARLAALTIAAVAVGLALSIGVSANTSKTLGGRAFSTSQLIQNIVSVGGVTPSGNRGNLSGALQFRGSLEGTVLRKELKQGKLVYGFGFGPNLALLAGVGTHKANNAALELRSPHNSHLDVLARMGLVGVLLWALFWLGWFRRAIRARRRFVAEGLAVEKGAIELCLLAVLGMLVICGFDPTLEGAQVAALLWTVTGLGVVLSSPVPWVAVSLSPLKVGVGHRRRRHRLVDWSPPPWALSPVVPPRR